MVATNYKWPWDPGNVAMQLFGIGFKILFNLINLHFNSYMWLVATVLQNANLDFGKHRRLQSGELNSSLFLPDCFVTLVKSFNHSDAVSLSVK